MIDEIGNTSLKLEANETAGVDVRVRDRTAMLTGILHQRGQYAGKAFHATRRLIDTWVQADDGRWLILAGHASGL